MNNNHATPGTLNILTVNCWGLKYLAKHRRARLCEIGKRIATSYPQPEIVGLQECWTQEDYISIRHETRHILPYGKFYYSGIFGGGLAILSKWPIVESSMVRFPLNGRPTAFFRGDWYVGKGVACARIRMGDGPENVAEVFCTHLHAPYEREPNDSYICHRTAQAWEIAKLFRGAAERGHLVIGLGDFNMVPLSLAHRLITAHAPVQDVWRVLHPDSSIGAAEDMREKGRGRPIPDAEYNLIENGTTCDSILNTWRWSEEQRRRRGHPDDFLTDSHTQDPRAKRLDYIFCGSGRRVVTGAPDNPNTSLWRVKNAKVGMIDRHPSLKCSLSDHFSVEATLQRSSGDSTEEIEALQNVGNGTYAKENQNPVLKSSRTADGEDGNPILSPSSATTLPVSFYDEILDMITRYKAREHRQRRLRMGHFVGSTVVSLGCLIAVWWSPHSFVSFILMLISTLGFTAGVIDGLIGGLFMNSELRALKEFEWEITNARKNADTSFEVHVESK
ncbi:phospholipase C type enzyme [Acarospora aff. strigata]|nr:phospholipase C type enzyme [Acarospora aff. strigata]